MKNGKGPSAESFIPLSVPCLRGNAWKYIKDCLDSGWVSSVGSYVNTFEEKLARDVGCKHAVACVNGTSALHVALMAAGLKPDEEVIVPALTFVAPANAIRYCHAYPVFMDVEGEYWQIDTEKLLRFLSEDCLYRRGKLMNQRTRRVVRGIVPVHVLGHAVDMDPLMALARKYGLWVIEDVAESVGVSYKGRKLGSIGDAGCFSFNGNKIITCGGGGMLTTNRQDWAKRARYLTTQAKDDPLEYIHKEVGYNYRLGNILAALGLAQLECLDSFIQVKRRVSQKYDQGFKDVPGLVLPKRAAWSDGYHWLYTILINAKTFGIDSRELLRKLDHHGIQTRPLWRPLHRLEPFRSCYAYHVKVADQLYRDALSLPSSVNLSLACQQKVIKQLCLQAAKSSILNS